MASLSLRAARAAARFSPASPVRARFTPEKAPAITSSSPTASSPVYFRSKSPIRRALRNLRALTSQTRGLAPPFRSSRRTRLLSTSWSYPLTQASSRPVATTIKLRSGYNHNQAPPRLQPRRAPPQSLQPPTHVLHGVCNWLTHPATIMAWLAPHLHPVRGSSPQPSHFPWELAAQMGPPPKARRLPLPPRQLPRPHLKKVLSFP